MSAAWLLLLVCVACAHPPATRAELVSLHNRRVGEGQELWLQPAAGARINARLKPVIELDSGGRVEFSAAGITEDSAYFTEPPRAHLGPAARSVKGILRVGVCPAGLNVCQSLALPIDRSLAGS
ncbi:MAG: hypothetical protein ABI647_09330 [Gemmatimonadota bacterium]